MEDIQVFTFMAQSRQENSETKTEHSYFCPESTMWTEVMRQFAVFLDSAGYVGVQERVDIMLDTDEESRWSSPLDAG